MSVYEGDCPRCTRHFVREQHGRGRRSVYCDACKKVRGKVAGEQRRVRNVLEMVRLRMDWFYEGLIQAQDTSWFGELMEAVHDGRIVTVDRRPIRSNVRRTNGEQLTIERSPAKKYVIVVKPRPEEDADATQAAQGRARDRSAVGPGDQHHEEQPGHVPADGGHPVAVRPAPAGPQPVDDEGHQRPDAVRADRDDAGRAP